MTTASRQGARLLEEREYTGPGEQEIEKATKDELKVAKWLKTNVPTKKTKFLNHNVEYFSAVRAIDALLASKFAQGDNCLFPHRQAVIDFMDEMLHHKLFHRARKVAVSEQELRGKSKKGSEKEKDQPKGAKDDKTTDGGESSHAEGKGGAAADKDKEKRKRKIRLEMHPEQLFVDGHEAYVWLYDPIPMHSLDLWGVARAAAGFLVFILGLAVLRFVIFCLVWIVTGGKHHFWLLPNLTEDVGFFASFWPLYDHEYKDGSTDKDKGKKKKKQKRDKDSDAEDEGATTNVPAKIDEGKEEDKAKIAADVESKLRNRRTGKGKVEETASDEQEEEDGEDDKK
ncbi:hypothetical protein quinque_015752 [Culex quinquefasciatus]